MTVPVPILKSLKKGARKTENFAGVASYALFFMKEDLASEPVLSPDGTYPGYEALTFKEGKGAYRVDCKIDVNKVTFKSLGQNKGFENTVNIALDRNDADSSIFLRALNNLDFGVAIRDGDDFQVLYHPQVPCKIDAGGIAGDTGDKADSDRQVTVAISCSRMIYGGQRVKGPITEAVEVPKPPTT